jgi:4-amino-4-deoxy-L-arabinose transferase-like glycosyltransferase
LVSLPTTAQHSEKARESHPLPSPVADLRQWRLWKILVLILIAFLCLSLFQLDHQSLWLDEVLSVRNSSPESSIFDPVLWLRGQGPLFFVLLHFWQNLVGTDEFSLRLLSVLLGGITLCLAFQLGLLLFSRRTAIVASSLIATSPFFIWYSQEVRYVNLMMAMSLLAMYCFWRAVSTDRLAWWVGYGLAATLAVAAFLSNVFLLLLQGGYLICSKPHRVLLKEWMISLVVFGVLFLWWANDGQVSRLDGYGKRILTAVEGNTAQDAAGSAEALSTGGSKKFNLAMMPYTFFAFNTGFSLGPSLRDLHESHLASVLVAYAPILIGLGMFFGALFVYGLLVSWRKQEVGVLFILWIAVPLAGVLGVSALSKMSYNVRYVAMVFPAYVFVLAAAITACGSQVIRRFLLVSVFSLNAVSLANYYFNPSYAREDARTAAQYIESSSGSQDIIVIAGNPTTLSYYYKGNLPMVVLERSAKKSPTRLASRLAEIGKNRERLWFVVIRKWEIDPSGQLLSALRSIYPESAPRQFPGVEVYAVTKPREIL